MVVSAPRLVAPRTLEVDLRDGEDATRAVHAGRGMLRVAVTPWADVSIDGRSLGVTPFPPVEVGEGAHVVTLKNGELGVTTKKHVVVAPNKETLLRADLFQK